MKRTLLFIALLVVIVVGSFFIYRQHYSLQQAKPHFSVVSTEAATTAYTIDARYPQFGIPAIDAQIKSDVDAAIAQITSLPPNPPDFSPAQNSFTGRFQDVYAGPDIVSAELILEQYTGGAHPNAALVGENFYTATGKALTLDDALQLIGMTLPQVASSSVAQLQQQLGGNLIFPDGAEPTPDNYAQFIVGTSTVSFIFGEYQVAPYSDGTQLVSFPRVH